MPPIAIAAGIGAAGSIGSAAIGAHAAGEAADKQYAAAQEQATRMEPFRQAGVSALPGLTEGIAPGGQFVTAPEFQAPTITDDPGYQFRLQQGQQALERSAAAKGGLLTGGTAKALERYAQGTASQEYANAYARALTEYGLGRQNTADAYNRLMGVSQLGLGATGAQNYATAQGAAAQASGIMGAGNAWSGGLQGATGSLGNYLLLSSLLGNKGSGLEVINQ